MELLLELTSFQTLIPVITLAMVAEYPDNRLSKSLSDYEYVMMVVVRTPPSTTLMLLRHWNQQNDNYFVDGNNAAISSNVSDDQGNPLGNVKIELLKDIVVFESTLSNTFIDYAFNDVEPGDYAVKATNPSDNPKNINGQRRQ